MLRAASPRTKILGYDHNWATHPGDIASTPPGEDPETDYPYQLLAGPAAQVDRRYGVPLLLRRPERADRAARRRSRTRASGSPSAPARTGRTTPREQIFRGTLTWHARTLMHRHHPQLGQVGGQLEHRARLHRRPAPRRLRHLHRPGHVQPDGTVTHRRRVLHDRPPVEVRAARRGPDREHVVRHDRVERAVDGRRVPQPGRLDRARRAQRERRPADFAVAVGDQRFEYTLPGGAVATFTWPRRRRWIVICHPVSLAGATATASVNGC